MMSGPYKREYLLERQRDPRRLQRNAFFEFAEAMRSGRMIAFTGAAASKHLGYQDWAGAAKAFVRSMGKGLAGEALEINKRLRDQILQADERFAFPDLMDLAELIAELDRHADSETFLKNRVKYAKKFELRLTHAEFSARRGIADALIRKLGIRRVITLNYDLELEWAAFLSAHDIAHRSADQRSKIWEDIVSDVPRQSSGRLERLVPGFGKVISEVMGGNDVAPLTSFALLGEEERCRILHLHGRQDLPESMILSRRDYRDLYWAAGFSKLSFEYGLRSILAGNPILFVGIGMSEFEVTRALQQHLSDNPNRRAVPMFILWTASPDAARNDMLRLLFYRKFGVHVLFDTEIARMAGKEAEYAVDRLSVPVPPAALSPKAALRWQSMMRQANAMALPLEYLAEWWRSGISSSEQHKSFRSAQSKYDVVTGHIDRVNIWHATGNVPQPITFVAPSALAPTDTDKWLIDKIRSGDRAIAIIGRPGSGRGGWSESLADSIRKQIQTRRGRVVVVNASFATETDSIFSILSGAFDCETAYSAKTSRFAAVVHMWNSVCNAHKSGNPWPTLRNEASELVLIINGIERLIAQDGSALSTEMDLLIRAVTPLGRFYHPNVPNPKIRLLLIGSQRLERYLANIAYGQFDVLRIERDAADPSLSKLVMPEQSSGHDYTLQIPSPSFFDYLVGKNPNLRGVPASVRGEQQRRRHFMANLADWIETEGPFSDPRIAFEILRVLAFVGQPTERSVIPHLLCTLRERPADFPLFCSQVQSEVDGLLGCGLLLDIERFPGQEARVGIHKTLVSELRQRYGVPLLESRLAASFNFGLYAAQSMDNIMPEQRWHGELSKMVDHLIGQFRDVTTPDPELLVAATRIQTTHAQELISSSLDRYDASQLARMAAATQSDCLRAALSLMRSFFSTPALLMHGNRGFDAWISNGPLTDHAAQLGRLIRVAREVTLVQDWMLAGLTSADQDRLRTFMGGAALYPDDLAWLYNELGVVLTAQGRLEAAHEALDEALIINERHIEFGERHHNWRRISLNRIQVLIDRGQLMAAEELLRDIASAIEVEAQEVERIAKAAPIQPAPTLPVNSSVLDSTGTAFRDYVLKRYAKGEVPSHLRNVDPRFPTNLILGCALVLGYQGLCHHLRGSLHAGLDLYDQALAVFEQIGEQRAYALFQRHRASLFGQLKDWNGAVAALRLCNAAAGHERQTDIDHSGRIALVEYGLFANRGSEHLPPNLLLPQLKETLRYATDSDMFRLQVEAMQVTAFVHWRNGDTDSALQYANDALAIASRNDFGLRRVSLRILLGRILASRNEKAAARQILREASRLAAGLGYARAVESAENELVRLDVDTIQIPKESANRA